MHEARPPPPSKGRRGRRKRRRGHGPALRLRDSRDGVLRLSPATPRLPRPATRPRGRCGPSRCGRGSPGASAARRAPGTTRRCGPCRTRPGNRAGTCWRPCGPRRKSRPGRAGREAIKTEPEQLQFQTETLPAVRAGPFCFRVREPDVTAGGRGRGGRSHRGNGFDGRPWRCRGLPGRFSGFRARLCPRAVWRRVPQAACAVGSGGGRHHGASRASRARAGRCAAKPMALAWTRGLPGAGGPVPAGLGHVAEAAVASHDGDGGAGQAGEAARQVADVRPAAVLVTGEVAHAVHAALHGPVAAHRPGWPGGAR